MEHFTLPSFDGSGPDSPKKPSKNSIPQESSSSPDKPDFQIFEKVVENGRDKPSLIDFNTSTFFEEGSLLTNIEDYAKRIKEDVDAYHVRVKKEADEIKEKCSQEEKRVSTLREAAESEAKLIVEAAEKSCDEISKQARDDGFKAGFDEGENKFKTKISQDTGNILALLKELKSLRLTMMQKYETQIASFCKLIAKKIVHSELKANDDFVVNLLKESMVHFEGMGMIRIRINPLELNYLVEHQDALAVFLDSDQFLSIKGDPNVKVASAVIESDLSMMDLDLDRQFKEIDTQIAEVIDDRKESYYKAQQSKS